MDGSPQVVRFDATTLWHFDAAEWAPSTASNTEHLSTLYVVCIGLGIAMSGSLYEAGFGVLTRRFPTTYTDQISRLTLVGGLAPTIFVVMSSLSQRRPRAIDDMRRARFSDRIARASCGGTDAGTRISRRRLSGVLCHGTFSTLRLRNRLEPMPFALFSLITN